MVEPMDGDLTLSNGLVELTITTAFGPRISHFNRVGLPNVLAELPDLAITGTAGDDFLLRGGHRLWAAPEVPELTYINDDQPVTYIHNGNQVTLIQPIDSRFPVEKQLVVTLDNTEPKVTLEHTLTNVDTEPVSVAAWAITMLRPGGLATVPLGSSDPDQFQADRNMVLWPYTDLADIDIDFNNRSIQLRGNRINATKVGTDLTRGWLSYAIGGDVFIKRATSVPGAVYADLGAACQVYINEHFVELETLGPLVTLYPGQSTSHTEHWELFAQAVAPYELNDI